ncbi:Uncharacterized protein APZ42_001850 [Daphnia magna]|uniref:Uncharacterized protein n=1 Tax=Daphnia magna TaxID=35525 RepID=A0A162C6K0_9CRUS|nr:Uncharacterized protein APZ42_001850 [Daphnia magna]
MNDVFDVLNGQFVAEGIQLANWWKKKKVLDAFLTVLDITEECHRTRKLNDPDIPVNVFSSYTTLQSWRVSVLSVIELTE